MIRLVGRLNSSPDVDEQVVNSSARTSKRSKTTNGTKLPKSIDDHNNVTGQLNNYISSLDAFKTEIEISDQIKDKKKRKIEKLLEIEVPIEASDVFISNLITDIDKTNDDSHWNLLNKLTSLGFISMSKYNQLIQISIDKLKLDSILLFIQYCPDLSERDIVKIINKLLALNSESFHKGGNDYTEKNHIHEEKKNKKSNKRKTVTEIISTDSVENNSSNTIDSSMQHWNYMYTLIHMILLREYAYSPIILTETIKSYLSPSVTSFILRLLSLIIHNHFSTIPIYPNSDYHTTHILSSHNLNGIKGDPVNGEISIYSLNDVQLQHAIIWIEACLDAHFASTIITHLYHESTRMAIKSLLLVLQPLVSTMETTEYTYSLASHISRMNTYTQRDVYIDHKKQILSETDLDKFDIEELSNNLSIKKKGQDGLLGSSYTLSRTNQMYTLEELDI